VIGQAEAVGPDLDELFWEHYDRLVRFAFLLTGSTVVALEVADSKSSIARLGSSSRARLHW
jgi:hypothetical protein